MQLSHDRRITNRLIAYWVEVKGDRLLPTETDINIQELSDVWEHCFLVQVRENKEANGTRNYRYTYIGESVIEALGNDLTGHDVPSAFASPDTGEMIFKFDKVIETATPIIDESEFINLQGISIKYRQCLLPFGADRENIGFILGGMKWKE